jgi:uncharacterized protein YoxC
MRNVRATLTRIKTGISEKMPDGNDVYGYPGISRDILTQAISECQGLVDGIEAKKETFDVVVFKREFAELGRSALDFLNSIPSDKVTEQFNHFLTVIAEIRSKLNLTFLLCVKESLRPESDLSLIRKSLVELKPLHDEYEEKLKAFQSDCDTTATKTQQITEDAEAITTEVKDIKTLNESIAKEHQNVLDVTKKIPELVKAIETSTAEIERQATAHKKNEQIITEKKGFIEKAQGDLDVLSGQLKTQADNNAKFQEEIRLTIDDANRLSMAGSFKKRKDEIHGIIVTSERILVSVLLLFGLATLALFMSSVNSGKIEYQQFFAKLPILTPFVWLAWFYTRKVGHLSRIGEDYSFKYAAAMAFEGYNKNCMSDETLSKKLLDISIENMGANPIRLYGDGDVPSGPIPEMLDKGSKLIDKIKP